MAIYNAYTQTLKGYIILYIILFISFPLVRPTTDLYNQPPRRRSPTPSQVKDTHTTFGRLYIDLCS